MAMRVIWTSESLDTSWHWMWRLTAAEDYPGHSSGAPPYSTVPLMWVAGTPNAFAPSTISVVLPSYTTWHAYPDIDGVPNPYPTVPEGAIYPHGGPVHSSIGYGPPFFAESYAGERYKLDGTLGRVFDSGALTFPGSWYLAGGAGNNVLQNPYVAMGGATGVFCEPRSTVAWGNPDGSNTAYTLDELHGSLGLSGIGNQTLSVTHFQDPENPPAMLSSARTFRSTFGIDRRNDRAFMRFDHLPRHQVAVFRFSTGEYLHSIYSANESSVVCLDPNGFAWIVDIYNRLCLYSYEGVFLGSWHQTGYPIYATNSEDNFCIWTWDAWANRFLMLPAEQPGDALQVLGVTPRTEEALLSVPVPRCVPRRYRATPFFVKASGTGNEPCTGRKAVVSGAATASLSTDKDGDVVSEYTPTVAGVASITFTVGS